jgi:hypothetical protein
VDFGDIKYAAKENLPLGFWVPVSLGPMPRNFLTMLQEEFNLRKAEIPDVVPAKPVRSPKAGPI